MAPRSPGEASGERHCQQTNLFEMRRLEMLSNTIFGVAMTLLAYDLPKASRFASAPGWIDILNVYAQPVIALAISFVVAGLFWFSHHRRLAVAPEASRGVVFLNLLFLLSIIILPVTNGLYGSYRLDGVVAVIYGIHLSGDRHAERAVVDFCPQRPQRSAIDGDGVIPDPGIRDRNGRRHRSSPKVAQFTWCLAFLSPVAGWLAGRRSR